MEKVSLGSDPVADGDIRQGLIHENANLESQCLDYIAAIESLAGAGAK